MTIRPPAGSDDAPLAPEVAADIEEHKKRIPLVWIPATISVGLLIAGIYLGARILTSHPHAKAAAVQIAPQVKRAEPLPQAEILIEAPESKHNFVGPVPPPIVASGNELPVITPETGRLYIQVGALNQEATRRFVQRLRDEKLEPHVAPGPRPEIMRVLIGPFENRDALKERMAQLEIEGIATFARRY
jgi:cell division septation protein DedD